MPTTSLASPKGRRRRRRSNSAPSRGFELSSRPFQSSSSSEDEVDEKSVKKTPPRPLHRRSRRYTADGEGSSFPRAPSNGSPEASPNLGPARATRRVTLDEENAFGTFGTDSLGMPSDSGYLDRASYTHHESTSASLHVQAHEQRGVSSRHYATDLASAALPITLPSWLFEVVDEDLPEDFSARSLFAELNMDPSHSLAKVSWVLLGAWRPQTYGTEANPSTTGLKPSLWVYDYDPAILARGNDFWGSFTMLLLHSIAHYHRGSLKVLPWILLVWAAGSGLLWFLIEARHSQQHQLRAKGPGIINQRNGKFDFFARHSTDNFGSFAESSSKERESTTSLSEFEDCAGAQPPYSSVLANQARSNDETTLNGTTEHESKNDIDDNRDRNQHISMMQMMGTLAYCSLPLTLVVGSLSIFRAKHNQAVVSCTLQFVGVVWASRAAAVVLSARRVPQSQAECRLAPVGDIKDAPSSSHFRKEADWLFYAADRKVIAYPIVLFYIYLLSLYND